MGAWRISEGQVPYRDFFIPYTPFSFYFLAFFYKIFGVSILTGRIAGALLCALFILSVLLLSAKAVKNPIFASVPIIMLTNAGMSMWNFPSHHWLGNVFTILSIYFLVVFSESQEKRKLFISGIFAGLCFISINDQGFYNIFFLFVWLLLISEKTKKANHALLFLGGVFVAVFPLFFYLILKVPLSTLIYDLIFFPFTGYKSIEGNKMSIFYPFKEIIYVWLSGAYKMNITWTIIATFSSLTIALLPFLALLSFLYLYIKDKDNKKVITILLLGSLTMILTAARRWAPINLIWAASIPSVLFSYALFKIYDKEKRSFRYLSMIVASFVIIVFFLFGAIRPINLSDKSRNIRVESRAGVLYLDRPYLASQLIGLLNAIEQIIPEKEPFLSKEVAILNFLALRKNPTKIDFFKPPYYSPKSQIDEVVKDLEDKNVRFIVSLNKNIEETNPFDSYLSLKFSPIWQNQEFVIYKRKEI
ncbi:MAG: glycosyltransferase family 39 protein [Acidobacteria bacterium]|nr:glycosyltransferase family 39 protein [Acidobacteriota bacterium]